VALQRPRESAALREWRDMGRYEDAATRRELMRDEAPSPPDRGGSPRRIRLRRFDEPVDEFEGHRDPGVVLLINAGARCRQPKLTGAERIVRGS
jgi:hypothetical protein